MTLVPAAATLTIGGVAGYFIRRLMTQPKRPKSIQIVYFSVRARAEYARLVLEYGGLPYEDLTTTQYFGHGWGAEARAKAPFSQLPILVVDGEVLAQSGAMTRYCARLVPSLVPTDALALARCEMIDEAAHELMGINPIVNVFRDDTFKAKKDEFFSAFPGKLANLERQLKGPFFFGASPLFCDFTAYHVLSNARLVEPGCLEGHPKVLAFMTAVEELPRIREYLAARPQCVGIGTKPMLEPNVVGARAKK